MDGEKISASIEGGKQKTVIKVNGKSGVGVREERMEELAFRIKTSSYDEQHIGEMIKKISAAYSGNCKLRIDVEIDESWLPTPDRWDHHKNARRVPYE